MRGAVAGRGGRANVARRASARWLALARAAGRADGRQPPADAAGGDAPTAAVRALARPLRALRLLRALARDPLVPPARRGGQVHRVHLRHGARAVPARLGGWAASSGAALAAPARGRCAPSCSASARSCVLAGLAVLAARAGCLRTCPSRVVLRLLGPRHGVQPRRRPGSRAASCASTCCCRRLLFGCPRS